MRRPSPLQRSLPSHPRAPTASALPAALALALALALGGCAAISKPDAVVYEHEHFEVRSPFARAFPVPTALACEAARRALLSQGYIVHLAGGEQVGARKSFQPRGDSHVQIEFNVVCAANSAAGGAGGSTAFVSAVQDRYALKKVSASASVGVGPVGSISLPFSAGDDSLVKVASETIPAGGFYQRFFALLEHHLAELDGNGADPSGDAASAASGREAFPGPGTGAAR